MAIYSIEQKSGNGTVELQIDAKSLDGHKVESTGVASNTTTIPTTAQVKSYTDGRFVAYDTNAQGLTTTQKSNARTNIGAGTSNIALGTTASTAAKGNHTHGNITNAGDITATGVTIASGDALVIRDSSASKLATTSIAFDGSTTTKFLSQKGTWESVSSGSSGYYTHMTRIYWGSYGSFVQIVWVSNTKNTAVTSFAELLAELVNFDDVNSIIVNGVYKTSSTASVQIVTGVSSVSNEYDEDDDEYYDQIVFNIVYYSTSKLLTGSFTLYQYTSVSINDIVISSN